MTTEHRVKVSRIGTEQVVQIPKDFEISTEEVLIRKVGDRLMVIPIPRKSLTELLDSWEPLDEDFPEIDDLPPDPVNI